MDPLTTAALIQGGASIVGGYLGDSASSKAASAQTKAANRSNALAYQQYLQDQQYQLPYRYVGNQALNMLASTYGLDPYSGQTVAPVANPMANMSPKQQKAMSKVIKKLGYNPLLPQSASGGSYQVANPMATGGNGALGSPATVSVNTDPMAPAAKPGNYNAFFASPDYQFRMDEQNRALDRSASARGMVNSGAQQKAIAKYSGNLASGEFNNWANRLASLANIAQTATNNVQQSGANYASNAQTNTTNAGDARASGYLGSANSWGTALSGVANAAGSYFGNKKQPYYDYSSGGYT